MEHSFHSLIGYIKTQLQILYDPVQAEQVALYIIQAITKKSVLELISSTTPIITLPEYELINLWLHKHRDEHMPLQYLIGSVSFCNLSLTVEPPILIPRPETEEWCATLIQEIKKKAQHPLHILDLCTGSGCIGLAFAQAFPHARVDLVDISCQALELARKNAHMNALENVHIFQSDLFDAIPSIQQYDFIVTNPPYISVEEWKALDLLVKDWEDPKALVAENDGLEIIFAIIDRAQQYVKPNLQNNVWPQLAIEVGYTQAHIVVDYMKKKGYKNIHIHQDYARKNRVVWGTI